MINKLIVMIFTVLIITHPAFAKNFGSLHCNDDQFTCYNVKRGDSWAKLFPDADERDLIMRINRMNTRLNPGMQIAIPATNNDNPLDYSPLPKQINPSGKKIIIISIHDLAFGAYDRDGMLEHWGPVSTGRGYCPDTGRRCRTTIGKFHIYSKQGSGCISSKYPIGRGGAPMPYCMFFHRNYALHGSYEVPGYNASHGCIRMFVNDAKWLNQDFTADEQNVTVVIRN